jgi:hypothetical protein
MKAEAANSRLKSRLTGRNLSLMSLRQCAINIDNQLRADALYLKAVVNRNSAKNEVKTFEEMWGQ